MLLSSQNVQCLGILNIKFEVSKWSTKLCMFRKLPMPSFHSTAPLFSKVFPLQDFHSINVPVFSQKRIRTFGFLLHLSTHLPNSLQLWVPHCDELREIFTAPLIGQILLYFCIFTYVSLLARVVSFFTDLLNFSSLLLWSILAGSRVFSLFNLASI